MTDETTKPKRRRGKVRERLAILELIELLSRLSPEERERALRAARAYFDESTPP